MSSDSRMEKIPDTSGHPESPMISPPCRLNGDAMEREGEVRCPVCQHIIPPEHIGYKLHCRRCGYLESCCNPIQSSL